MVIGFRRGVSGSSKYSDREAKAIHSVVGATDRIICPIAPQVSWTETEALELQVRCDVRQIRGTKYCGLRRQQQDHYSLPFIKRRPSHLDGTNDSLFKMFRVLLHDDDALLQGILLVDLSLKLSSDEAVGVPDQVDENTEDQYCKLEQCGGETKGLSVDHDGTYQGSSFE